MPGGVSFSIAFTYAFVSKAVRGIHIRHTMYVIDQLPNNYWTKFSPFNIPTNKCSQ